MGTTVSKYSVKKLRNVIEDVDRKMQICIRYYVDRRRNLSDGRLAAVASVCNQKKKASWIGTST
jgi:hypothetical protein